MARIQRGIECDSCELWTHAKCIEMSISEHESLTEGEIWLCSKYLPTTTTEPIDVLSYSSETEDDGDDGTVEEVEEQGGVKPNNPKSQHGDQRKTDPETKNKINTKADIPALREHNLFSEMKCIKTKAGKSPVLAHQNINSYKFKYIDIASIIIDKLFDIFLFLKPKVTWLFLTHSSEK